ncbi:hypothetical protein ACB094_11G188500 [Castanea mollissima]
MIRYHVLFLSYLAMYLASKSQCKNHCECSCQACQLKFFFKYSAPTNHCCPKRRHSWFSESSNPIDFPKSFDLSMKGLVAV